MYNKHLKIFAYTTSSSLDVSAELFRIVSIPRSLAGEISIVTRNRTTHYSAVSPSSNLKMYGGKIATYLSKEKFSREFPHLSCIQFDLVQGRFLPGASGGIS